MSHLSGGAMAVHPQHVLPLHNKSFLISFSFWENLANLYVATPTPEELQRPPMANPVSVPAPRKKYIR